MEELDNAYCLLRSSLSVHTVDYCMWSEDSLTDVQATWTNPGNCQSHLCLPWHLLFMGCSNISTNNPYNIFPVKVLTKLNCLGLTS